MLKLCGQGVEREKKSQSNYHCVMRDSDTAVLAMNIILFIDYYLSSLLECTQFCYILTSRCGAVLA